MKEFVVRRDALYDGLKSIDEPGKPEGAFYLFPDFSEFVPKDLSKTEGSVYMYKKFGVATVYG